MRSGVLPTLKRREHDPGALWRGEEVEDDWSVCLFDKNNDKVMN